MKHTHVLYRGEFSPDGALVATASADHTARVWDAATGQAVTPFLSHQDDVGDVAFGPDGRSLITASADYTARLWTLPVCTYPLSDLQKLAQLWSARRLDPAGGAIPLEPGSLRGMLDDLRARHPDLFERPTPDAPPGRTP
jgi:WD40 repeat protein